MVLGEGELISELLQSTQLPGHRKERVVVQMKDVGLLSVQEDFLKLQRFPVHLEFRLHSVTADVEDDWVGVVLNAADQSIFDLS